MFFSKHSVSQDVDRTKTVALNWTDLISWEEMPCAYIEDNVPAGQQHSHDSQWKQTYWVYTIRAVSCYMQTMRLHRAPQPPGGPQTASSASYFIICWRIKSTHIYLHVFHAFIMHLFAKHVRNGLMADFLIFVKSLSYHSSCNVHSRRFLILVSNG